MVQNIFDAALKAEVVTNLLDNTNNNGNPVFSYAGGDMKMSPVSSGRLQSSVTPAPYFGLSSFLFGGQQDSFVVLQDIIPLLVSFSSLLHNYTGPAKA